MRNLEILAPAGSFEALEAAIKAGANAIYLGGKNFGARAFANNFDYEELKEAIEYAHAREVKIYVTVNTLIYDEEIDDVLEYIGVLYKLQVDAILIQDLGLMSIVSRMYPDFDIHVSTQASIHNLEGIKAMEQFNVKRIVLARENTIDEIKYIANNTNLEIEVFIHGALCMSYSGQCLMSSMIGGRSGNRGTCAQPCRKKYTLIKDYEPISDNAYLLSPKDICTIDHFNELIEAGVTSFKIEGRMKKSEYVYEVVSMYANALNNYKMTHIATYNNEQLETIKQLFNRGLTKGYAFNETSILSDRFPGHLGRKIGKVVSSDETQVGIELSDELVQNDGIRFGRTDLGRIVNKIYHQNHLVSGGKKGDIIKIEFNQEIPKNTPVYLTSDSRLLNSIQHKMHDIKRKVKIDCKVEGKLNEPVKFTIQCGKHIVSSISEELLSLPINAPVTLERLQAQLSKFGNSVYEVNTFVTDLPETFYFSMKSLNMLRQDVISKMDDLRNITIHNGKLKRLKRNIKENNRKLTKLYVYASTLEQAKVALDYHVSKIMYPINKDTLKVIELAKEYNTPFYLYVGRIHSDKELHAIKNMKAYKEADGILVGDISAYECFNDKEIMFDYTCNITNSLSLKAMNEETILSVEMSEKQINNLSYDGKFGSILYGHVEDMISKYCPISAHYNGKKVIGCNKCKEGIYALQDFKNEQFPIMMDEHCRMHLLSHKKLKYTYFNNLKVDFGVLRFTTENEDMTNSILNDYTMILDGYEFKESLNKEKYTLGYFKK